MKAAIRDRTNVEWLAELGSARPAGEAAQELRNYLRNALARTLRGRAGVDASDVEDFTQEALVRVLQNLERFRGDSRFTTWAAAVAVRVALSSLRRRRCQHRPLEGVDLENAALLSGASSAGRDPSRALERSTLLATLHHSIGECLTERQRVVILGELAGVPSSVLAERLGTNPNALYKLHHDARKKLKRAINAAGYSDEDVRDELVEASEPA